MEKIKKYKDVIAIFLIFLIISIMWNWIIPDYTGDQLWLFQNLYKINNGYKLYVDANVITTPMFYYIGTIFFVLLGKNMLVFDIYNAFMNATLITIIYLIFKNLKISKTFSIISILYIIMLVFDAFYGRSANYNFLSLIWILSSILLAIKNNKTEIKGYAIKQGILCFFAIMTKQNTGIYYLIGLTLWELIEKNKKTIKKLIKIYCTIFILGIIFLIYLALNNTLNGFFYYALSGGGDFFLKNIFISKTLIKDSFFLVALICNIVGWIMGILIIKSKKNKDEIKNIKLLMIISFFVLLEAFPILDNYHISIGLMPSFINFIYCLNIVTRNIKINNYSKSVILLFILIPIAVFNIVFCSISLEKDKIYTRYTEKKEAFYGSLFPIDFKEAINEVDKYIVEKEQQGINVIIIDASSNLYMVPLNKSNGKFDCFNNGNLGRDGAEGAIEDIKQMKNTEILIVKDDEKVGWQEPKEVRKYIKENLKKMGEILGFSIYATQTEGE